VGGKNKGGREARKPKQDQNKKQKGQTPRPKEVEVLLHPAKPPGTK
jgi:hypothetical protein